MNPGYITLSRKFFECDLWREKRPRTKAEAWLDLIQLAAFAPHTVTTSVGTVALERGELLASLRFLADRWDWSVKQVRRWLATVQRVDRLRAQREAQAGTVYVIVNYAFYQGADEDEGTAAGIAEGTPRAQQGHKDKKGKKGKKESQNKAPAGADDPEFCAVYAALPRRSGGHDRRAAHRNYLVSVAGGAVPAEMLEGAHRYSAFCDAINKTGTPYVFEGKNFLGERELWKDAWDVPLTVSRGGQSDAPPPNAADGWYGPGLEEATRPSGFRPWKSA